MKHVIVFAMLIQLFSLSAVAAKGIGGSGGGANAKVQINVEVCGGGEPGLCRTVTYEVSGKDGKAVPVSCTTYYDQERAYPCEGPGLFPNWLRTLNEAYRKTPEERAREDHAIFLKGD